MKRYLIGQGWRNGRWIGWNQTVVVDSSVEFGYVPLAETILASLSIQANPVCVFEEYLAL
ncbi:hypothetical protein [Sulfobacillus thermosulfidooxidans]|uniref:hypothetical protein n=1 Tax=Sulfobacillus thermosulfidooxidans TaxID=28034 RepID=UPI00096B90AD|nr:hypothetical protein [Sulfobacillus thermosulfidooxidans]OLZ08763.1 hypothetical protein BFX05_15220 [Sulfobacillus thermosulfidooxidans]OLZ14817.1 hypothetical protein BFX06_05815 [Sulfobacillus thermosulfidooxidans]OLZ22039.1 hypothetical protein BFX07_10555 [Sulfobacillus thermosulfidooxidans]